MENKSPAPLVCAQEGSVIESYKYSYSCYLGQLPSPPSSVYDTIIEVAVGKSDPKIFQIYKGLLAHYSTIFAAAFQNRGFIEAQSGVVRLEDDDPAIFQLFYNFIYTRKVTDDIKLDYTIGFSVPNALNSRPFHLCLWSEVPASISEQEQAVSQSFEQLFALSVFADMRGAPIVLDTTLSLIFRKIYTECVFPVDLLPQLQDNMPAHCSLTTMLADLISLFVDKKEVERYEEYFPQSMLIDIYKAQCELASLYSYKRITLDLTACTWHESEKVRIEKNHGRQYDTRVIGALNSAKRIPSRQFK